MNCIIVDDEPLAREAVEMLINETGQLTLAGSFNNAASAAKFIHEHPVDLIFLDIRMPKVTGLEFARTIPKVLWSYLQRPMPNMPSTVTKWMPSTIWSNRSFPKDFKKQLKRQWLTTPSC